MVKKLYALLVGIDEYDARSKNMNNLKGCINDIKAVKYLLHDKYYYLDPEIQCLTNAKATRQNIINTFRNHLTANASDETTLLFYFGGHGSQQSASKYFQDSKTNNVEKDATLVCYDSRVVVDGKMVGLDLADKEVAILVEEASLKNAHIVVVFDCCHGGHVLKESYEVPNSTKRELEEFERENKYNYNYLGNYFEKVYKKHNKIIMPSGKYFFLAACEKDQMSREVNINDDNINERRGIFSYLLERTIRKNPQISYFELYMKLKYDSFILQGVVPSDTFKLPMKLLGYKQQTPRHESYNGFDSDLCFISGKEL